MKYIQTRRLYTMSDSEMWWIIVRICKYLREDISVLSKYNIDNTKVEYLESLCNSIQYANDDVHYQVNIYDATRELELALNELKEAISIIVILSKSCFGAKSPFVKNLELSEYANFPFDKLISSAKAIIPLLESNLDSLKEVGLTAETIQDLSDKIKSSEEAKLAQKKQKEDRINATHDRIKLLNEAYEQVMTCAAIAKTVFAKSDPTRASYYSLSRYRKMKREKADDTEGNEDVNYDTPKAEL